MTYRAFLLLIVTFFSHDYKNELIITRKKSGPTVAACRLKLFLALFIEEGGVYTHIYANSRNNDI